jgi:hypothetical protein
MKCLNPRNAVSAGVLKAAPTSVNTVQRYANVKSSDGNKAISVYRQTAEPSLKVHNGKRTSGKWNNMLHLSMKRFADNDPTLTPGARRNRQLLPHVAVIEKATSGRSKCKQCGVEIQPKGTIRIVLMMECNKGYRNPCTLHETCFWKHREFGKIDTVDEIYIHPSIVSDDPNFSDRFKRTFDTMKHQIKND